MLKKGILLLIVLALFFLAIGCGERQDIDKEDNTENNMEIITLYFADEEAINLVSEKVQVDIEGKSIENVIIGELQKGPREPEKGHNPTIPSNIKILGVEVKDNTAFINISSENLTGGSTEEKFLIDSVVMSLTEVDYIDKVQFQVDGEGEGTLMGHFTIDEPFTSEDIK